MSIVNLMKKHKLLFIFSGCLLIYYCFCWYNYRIIECGREHQIHSNNSYNLCEKYIELSEEEKEEFIEKNYDEYYLTDEICESYMSYNARPYSAFTIFENFIKTENFLIPFFIPIIVLIPFLYILSKEFQSKYIKNYCMRESYSKYRKHIFGTAYKNVFTIPVIIIVTFIISYILSHGNLNPDLDIGFHHLMPNMAFSDSILFWIFYIIVLFAGAGLFINIGLIVVSKNKNFIIALLESILVIFLIWGFCEIAIGIIVYQKLGMNPDNFNILNFYDWGGVSNMYIYFGFNVFLYIISLIVAIISYKDKEKIVMLCEK